MGILKIGVFAGSLRRESFSGKIAGIVADMLPEDLQVKTVDIGGLVLYNQDYDDQGAPPREWAAFRQEIASLDGFLFVTPEYNRSMTPALKNALDIGSRPFGQNLWSGKPGALISISQGQLGGFGANHHLRQTMSFLNILLLSQPEAYIGNVASLLNGRGEPANQSTKNFLQEYAGAFALWVRRFARP
ncbi:MAG: NAD(P)H-dependent oxidoreductase [Treponema sp.]|jgi:chromate reductase|nr:NAD(P)H-dependent oxidoreductase [Treponema sp.]